MKKFNPKEYKGLDRVYMAVPGAPRITRVYHWNGSEYVPPARSFRARRYEPKPSGIFKRTERYFGNLNSGREWQSGKPDIDKIERTGKYTVAHLIRDYKESRFPLLRESTQIYYNKAFRLYEFLYPIELKELKPSHIDGWLMHVKKSLGKANRPRKDFLHELESLGTMLRWYIDMNDDTRLVLPFKKRHKQMAIVKEGVTREKRFMNPEEAELFLESLKIVAPEFYAMGFVQIKQVMRVSEVAAMKWQNLNVRTRSYRLCEHAVWPRVDGKPPEIISGTKNVKAGRFFEMPLRDEVIALLSTLPRGQSKQDLIFHDVNGEVFTYRQIQYAYNRAFRRAKLPYSSTHVCRHTGATQFLNETGDILALKQMGNWSDLKTAQLYGQILSSRAREALDRISGRHLRLVESTDAQDASGDSPAAGTSGEVAKNSG